jgi:hypothetical protein
MPRIAPTPPGRSSGTGWRSWTASQMKVGDAESDDERAQVAKHHEAPRPSVLETKRWANLAAVRRYRQPCVLHHRTQSCHQHPRSTPRTVG